MLVVQIAAPSAGGCAWASFSQSRARSQSHHHLARPDAPPIYDAPAALGRNRALINNERANERTNPEEAIQLVSSLSSQRHSFVGACFEETYNSVGRTASVADIPSRVRHSAYYAMDTHKNTPIAISASAANTLTLGWLVAATRRLVWLAG